MSEEENIEPTVEEKKVPRTDPMEEWKCEDEGCGTTFLRLARWRGRRRSFCDDCSDPLKMRRRHAQALRNKKVMDMERAQVEIPKIIDTMVENPGITPKKIGSFLNIPTVRVMHYMATNILLSELKRHASNKITEMIPKAIRAIDQIVGNRKHTDQFRAATEILKSERVLGPDRLDVNVKIEKRSIEELQDIIAEAAKIPKPAVIEAELISDSDNP